MPIKIKFVPESGNCEGSASVIPVVTEALIAPDNVVVKAPTSSPPQVPKDHPKPFACTAGQKLSNKIISLADIPCALPKVIVTAEDPLVVVKALVRVFVDLIGCMS